MLLPRLMIAAPSSGQGKTTAAMGIMATLKRRGLRVQPYKVGPDYIDPAFHTAITGQNSVNLDSWLLDSGYLKKMICTYSRDADISIIEGVMGLYDGFGSDPLEGSTAGIAKLLKTPIILVIQANGMAASTAALVYGMKEFGKCDIKAVIINMPSSFNHYNIVKKAIEEHTGVDVIGYIPKSDNIELKSRHLGLVQCCETEHLSLIIEKLADVIEDNIDLEKLLSIAGEAEELHKLPMSAERKNTLLKIGVAMDAAFSFYYHENLELMKRLGAELVYFSPLSDQSLPNGIGGIYIGGGYPEVFAERLSMNIDIKIELKKMAEAGMPIYAECGGFMYLNESIQSLEGNVYPMVGIFDGKAEMTERLQNFGYLELEALDDNYMLKDIESLKAHEFHKSKITRQGTAFSIKARKSRNSKLEEWCCGMSYKNVFAMYPHVYFPSNVKYAENFINKCREYLK